MSRGGVLDRPEAIDFIPRRVEREPASATGGAIRGASEQPQIDPDLTAKDALFYSALRAASQIFAPESIESSVADALGATKARLQEIRHHVDVDEAAVALAEQVIDALMLGSLVPSRVVVTADREVAFVFFGDEVQEGGAHRLVATLTCSSDDELSALIQDRRAPQTQAWDLEVQQLRDALNRISSFVSGR
jgi:hypothetical protein